ncbi:MAG: hypothetical protein AAF969_14485 [Bacteroidota bacterium]
MKRVLSLSSLLLVLFLYASCSEQTDDSFVVEELAPWGRLGHLKTEDVQKVLERNLKGLTQFRTKIN